MSALTRSWYGLRVARTSSGSARSERSVKPTRSTKSTETTLRSSPGAAGSARALPQARQKRACSGFSVPHAGQTCISRSSQRRGNASTRRAAARAARPRRRAAPRPRPAAVAGRCARGRRSDARRRRRRERARRRAARGTGTPPRAGRRGRSCSRAVPRSRRALSFAGRDPRRRPRARASSASRRRRACPRQSRRRRAPPAGRGARRRPARTRLLPGAPDGTPSPRERRSRIDAPRLERGRDLADPRGERRRPETDVSLLGEVPDAVEGGRELLGELRPDLVARPEDAPEILDPLEVRDGHAAGIREDVGKDRNAALGEDRVRSDRRRPVRTLGHHPRPKTRRVVGMHLILAGGEHEDVAVELEQLLVGHALAVVTAGERILLADVLLQGGNVEADLRADPTRHVRHRRHPGAEVVELARGDAPDVAEALDDAALLGELPPEPRARAHDHHHHTGASCLVPEDGAADRDRLAGDNLGHRVPALHRVRVHHPRHRLLVRGHVRRGDVLLRPDDRKELGREAARQPLDLRDGQLARIAANASLRAAVREAQERALPGHPHRERRALAERDLEVVTDAALGRPQDARVLDAVAGVHDPRLVVHPDRDADDDRALGVTQSLRVLLRDARDRNRLVELRHGHAVQRRVPLERGMGKRFRRARHGARSVPARPGTNDSLRLSLRREGLGCPDGRRTPRISLVGRSSERICRRTGGGRSYSCTVSPTAAHAQDSLARGYEALASGNWLDARDAFASALSAVESPEALDGLGRALWWRREERDAVVYRERAYAGFRRDGELARAARIALWLSREYALVFGNEAAARGWLARAERLLRDVAPGAEQGWLDLGRSEQSREGSESARLASQALDVALRAEDTDLELRALAQLGFAEVALGSIEQGLAHLDEAMAAATSGEPTSLETFADVCCTLMLACERAGDAERPQQWSQVLEEFVRRYEHVTLLAFCRTC